MMMPCESITNLKVKWTLATYPFLSGHKPAASEVARLKHLHLIVHFFLIDVHLLCVDVDEM